MSSRREIIADSKKRREYLEKMFDTSEDRESFKRVLDDPDECRYEIEDYCDDLDNPTLAKSSVEHYQAHVRWFNMWLDYHGIGTVFDLKRRDVRRLGRDLVALHNGTMSDDRWCEIRSFYQELISLGEMDENPLDWYHEKRKSKFGMERKSEKSKILKSSGKKAALNIDEVRLLEKTVGRPRKRNQLIVRLLWQTGLRRGELANILYKPGYEFPTDAEKLENGEKIDPTEEERWEQRECDIDLEHQIIRVRPEVSKTESERLVSYKDTCRELMEHWLEIGRSDMLDARTDDKIEKGYYDEDPDADYLFYGINGNRLRGDSINTVVKNAADKAEIQSFLYKDENGGTRDRITAHALRHGLGHYLVHKANDGDGVDIYKVSKILGHSSVDITEEIYVQRELDTGLRELQESGPE